MNIFDIPKYISLFLYVCPQLYRACDFAHVLIGVQEHACGDHWWQVPLLRRAIHLTF